MQGRIGDLAARRPRTIPSVARLDNVCHAVMILQYVTSDAL